MRSSLKSLLPPPAARRIPFGVASGITMHVDFAQQTRTYLGLYELELDRHLRRLCRPGMRCFDVGAQFGYDALILAKRCGAPVASFEADPGCFDALRANVAANPRLEPLITPVLGFVGAGDDDTLSLDDFACSDGGFEPDFLKIDVDGGEHDALLGAREILAGGRPNLIVEVHSEELERRCGELLHEQGYRPLIVNQRRFLPDYRPIGHNRWLVAEGRAAHVQA